MEPKVLLAELRALTETAPDGSGKLTHLYGKTIRQMPSD